jgi:putative glutamine amidotransferase
MAARPRIGVTGNARRWAPAWWCTALALRLAGAIPERISVRHPPSGKPLQALVIGGGNDISPEHYGGELDAKVLLDPERDQLEMHWIRWAQARGLPLLGICRGAQLINVVAGGNLHPDLRSLRRLTSHRPSLLPRKPVALAPDSMLARICGRTRLHVNSLHHQAVHHCGEGLRVVARDRDAIVQAIESGEAATVLGLQWHPEYLCLLPSQFRVFRWLVAAART